MNANDNAPPRLSSPSEEKVDKKDQENVEDPVFPSDKKPVADGDAPVNLGPSVKSPEYESSREIVQSDSTAELPYTLHERFLRIKQSVKDAIAAHHTFLIYGRSRVIRECMLKRGWCEKFYRKSNNDQFLNIDSNPVTLLSGLGDLKDQQSERQLISRMLSNHTVDFLWNTGSEWPGWPAQDNKTTVFNRFCRAGFTSKDPRLIKVHDVTIERVDKCFDQAVYFYLKKSNTQVGLCSNVRQMHWYYEAGIANTLFPRCYNICQSDQMHAFIEDFRFTACLSLLKWLVNKINTEGENATRSPTGTIPLKALDFAIKRCTDYISAQSHEDIDQEAEKIWAHQWDQFIGWYYKVVQEQALFVSNNVPFQKYFLAARHMLRKVKKYWPQLDMDGITNVWILKPGNKSRGRGIVLLNKLDDVLAKMNPSNKSDTRYVVQKYIERPLLIYSTKFDIRQWFIVTCAQPLTFWMYKESYLRFCSQKFSLADFHESIHLCNHAIQCKYKNSSDRDSALPADNMWDATTFKQFLKAQGHENAWDELIYPGMKQGLVGSLLASQEAMDRRKNSFELYGADFMIMEDFSVWLIEINSHPDMSYSSIVTTRLCRQVMEDTIKVVIDLREDKNADTGQFELAYKQRMPSCQPYLGAALSLQGTRIATCEKRSNMNLQDSKVSLVPKSPTISLLKKKSQVHTQIGPVIVDLIEELEIQLDQEFYSYFKTESSKHRQVLPVTAPPSKLSKSPPMIDKAEVTIKCTSASTATANAKAKLSSHLQNNQAKTLSNTRNVPQKMAKKPRGSHPASNHKQDISPTRQPLYTKIMALQQQSINPMARFDKFSRQNEEKIISTAVRDAVKKYKRSGNIPQDVSQLPSLHGPKSKAASSSRTKTRGYSNKKQSQQKKNKILADITDMYAVGLGLTK